METKLQQLTVDERIKLVEDLWDSMRPTRAHFRLRPIREPNSTAVSMHTRLTRIVDDRRRTPFATFAAGCDRRGPAPSGSRTGPG